MSAQQISNWKRQFLANTMQVFEKPTAAAEHEHVAELERMVSNQKQLAIQRLPNVRTCIGLAVLSLQGAMLANNIWNLPFRTISTIQGAFA